MIRSALFNSPYWFVSGATSRFIRCRTKNSIVLLSTGVQLRLRHSANLSGLEGFVIIVTDSSLHTLGQTTLRRDSLRTLVTGAAKVWACFVRRSGKMSPFSGPFGFCLSCCNLWHEASEEDVDLISFLTFEAHWSWRIFLFSCWFELAPFPFTSTSRRYDERSRDYQSCCCCVCLLVFVATFFLTFSFFWKILKVNNDLLSDVGPRDRFCLLVGLKRNVPCYFLFYVCRCATGSTSAWMASLIRSLAQTLSSSILLRYVCIIYPQMWR